MFRKREIKRDSIRKIRTVAEEEEEEDLNATEEVEQLELLREMRSEQKDRRRDAGIDTSKLMNASGCFALQLFFSDAPFTTSDPSGSTREGRQGKREGRRGRGSWPAATGFRT